MRAVTYGVLDTTVIVCLLAGWVMPAVTYLEERAGTGVLFVPLVKGVLALGFEFGIVIWILDFWFGWLRYLLVARVLVVTVHEK